MVVILYKKITLTKMQLTKCSRGKKSILESYQERNPQ